jgi:hypothetical protein
LYQKEKKDNERKKMKFGSLKAACVLEFPCKFSSIISLTFYGPLLVLRGLQIITIFSIYLRTTFLKFFIIFYFLSHEKNKNEVPVNCLSWLYSREISLILYELLSLVEDSRSKEQLTGQSCSTKSQKVDHLTVM